MTTTTAPTRSPTELMARARAMHNAVKADPDVPIALIGMSKLLVSLTETVQDLSQQLAAAGVGTVFYLECAKCSDPHCVDDVYHRRGCEYAGEVLNPFAIEIPLAEAKQRGLVPCSSCCGGT